GEVSETEAITRLSRAPHWVWVAMDPVSKLLLAIDVGSRTLAMAPRVLQQVGQGGAPGCTPLLLTDGFKAYTTAWLTPYGQWVQVPRREAPGAAPPPRWMPLPELLAAQVVKTVRQRRLVGVTHRGVFGTIEAVNQVLRPLGWPITTAFVERLNLRLRHPVAAIGRRVTTLGKGEEGVRQQLVLFQGYHNFCLPHARLRLPLAEPEATNGTGAAKRWCLQPPAMAAGLTDHVGSVREVLLCR